MDRKGAHQVTRGKRCQANALGSQGGAFPGSSHKAVLSRFEEAIREAGRLKEAGYQTECSQPASSLWSPGY